MKIEQLQNLAHPNKVVQNNRPGHKPRVDTDGFSGILKQKMSPETSSVKFSAHAADRLASRNIVLSKHDLSRIENAVERMETKGAKESLLVMGDLALVVSVKNRTIITAMSNTPGDNNKVFTNIDSALIM